MKKFTPEARFLPTALLIALAVHMLLLGLFRYTPREAPKIENELPPISLLNLSASGNALLCRWIENHDPTLIAAPNAEHGYGRFAVPPPHRDALEDLPAPPVLAAPRRMNPAPIAMLGNSTPPLALRLPAVLAAETPAATPPATIAAFNGKLLPKLSNTLRRNRVAVAGETVIHMDSPRLPGLEPRLELRQSAGNATLDTAALLAAADSPECAAMELPGLLTVRWVEQKEPRK